MKILFLTSSKTNSLSIKGIYTDLLNKFLEEGHQVIIVTPLERREKQKTQLLEFDHYKILKVKTFNLQKTNIIEKGIGTLAIEYQYLSAIKKFIKDTDIDLVLYSTPPITFSKVITYIKKKYHAQSYLLLKDIFPQNAVDMKMMKKGSLLHKIFTKKEKKLYEISDTIGCMSEANVAFVLKNNKELDVEKVVVNPNCIHLIENKITEKEKINIRKKYKVPLDKTVFIYGGNLGIPQGIDFLLETILQARNPNVFFIIIGFGTEYEKVKNWFQKNNIENAILLDKLPKEDYDQLVASSDVGLIFLHKNFTIPNFPSRLLTYLEMKLPVIAATDENTDIGTVLEKGNCGFRVISGDLKNMLHHIDQLAEDQNMRQKMGENAWKLVNEKYSVNISYDLIMKRLKNV